MHTNHLLCVFSSCPLPFLTTQLLFHITHPWPHLSDPSSACCWPPHHQAIQSSSAKTLEGFATCTRFGWLPSPHGLSFMLCVSQRQEDAGYSHISNPSTVNWNCRLEAVALKTGTHVVLSYISGPTSFRVKAPATFSICDSCPCPLISPMLSHFHHQCPSQTRLPKHLLQTPLKSTCLPTGVGREGRQERDFKKSK